MRSILLSLILLLPIPALAQDSLAVTSVLPCGDPQKIFKSIADNRESLLFTSQGAMMLAPTYRYYKGVVMVFVNQETSKFTIAVQWPEGHVCVVAAGVNFEPYGGFQPWNHPDLEDDL